MKKALKIILIIIGVLAVIAGGLFLTYKLKFDPYRGTDKVFAESMQLDEEISVTSAIQDMEYVMDMMRSRHPAWLEEDNERVQAVEDAYQRELHYLQEDEDFVITVLDEWRSISSVMHELYDGHTRIAYRYSEERYIDPMPELIAYGRPVKINGEAYEDVEAEFLSLYPYEMEEYAREVFVTGALLSENYLKWIGVDVSDGVTLTFKTEDGEKDFHYDFEAYTNDSSDDDGDVKFVEYDIDTENGIGVFSLYSCINNDEYKETVKNFFTEVNENGIENIIVDLRWNGGGNSGVADEFIRYLSAPSYYGWESHVRFGNFLYKNERQLYTIDRLDPVFSGKVYVLTNLRTFSAAMDFTMLIMDNGLGTVVGEHCGNLPDAYGDILQFATPNARLPFCVSYKRWFRVDESKSGEPLEPDVPCDGDDALDVAYGLILGTYVPENTSGKIDDNGQPIADYYTFVNGEWLEEQAAAGKEYYLYADTERALVRDRVRDILENTDISALSEDDDLYKVITFYREVVDTSDVPERMEALRAKLEAIDNAKNLNDLYALYADEEYALYDSILNFSVEPDDNGYNTFVYRPDSYSSVIDAVTGVMEYEEDFPDTEFFYSYMEKLGYSRERTDEIFSNASDIAKIVDAYVDKTSYSSYLYYYDADRVAEMGVDLPIFDILDGCVYKGNISMVLMDEGTFDFWNELYKPENFKKLRDHMIVGCAMGAFVVTGYQEYVGYEDVDYADLILDTVLKNATDALAAEYMNRYCDDATMDAVVTMSQEIKRAASEVFKDTEWLSEESRDAASLKVLSSRINFGECGDYHELNDVELTGDVMRDYLSLCVSLRRFKDVQTYKEDDIRQIFDYDLFDVNAMYYTRLNKLVISTGLICNPHCSADVPYEERLGYLGATFAHEIFHGFDPNGINYDKDGYFIPWLTEAENTEYANRLTAISNFFDGLDLGYGKTLTGNTVVSETVADLMAIRVCLNILAQRENPDYDLFFRTYAESKAGYYTEVSADYVASEVHLPGRERVNYVLGQFEEFYNTYEYDESSPWFVWESYRLSVF